MEALKGVKILDMTHVQSGPTCTQLLAWFGADVVKVERPGVGDATRGQLRDVPDADSLYFTMLNSNKRSITLNPKKPEGSKIFTKQICEKFNIPTAKFGIFKTRENAKKFLWQEILKKYLEILKN